MPTYPLPNSRLWKQNDIESFLRVLNQADVVQYANNYVNRQEFLQRGLHTCIMLEQVLISKQHNDIETVQTPLASQTASGGGLHSNRHASNT